MAISNRPWGNVSQADYPDAGAYCDACLINGNTGPRARWTKAACKLPVREPNGDLNRNGVHAAAARLAGAGGGVDASPEQKRSAARKIAAHYRQLDEALPDSMRRMMSAGG